MSHDREYDRDVRVGSIKNINQQFTYQISIKCIEIYKLTGVVTFCLPQNVIKNRKNAFKKHAHIIIKSI